jgi:hypothetical protein
VRLLREPTWERLRAYGVFNRRLDRFMFQHPETFARLMLDFLADKP